jgi:hypothetical protein
VIGAIRAWGSTAEERAEHFACDRLLADPQDTCYRAIDVQAPVDVVFRWLCQLRAAPYSYDWIDNLGQTSPRFLVPGLDELAVGQRAMRVFVVADFEPGRQVTFSLHGPSRLVGDVVATYAVRRTGPRTSRIVVKLSIRWPGRVAVLRRLIPPLGDLFLIGDLVMMRRQLMNLRDLAEGRTAAGRRVAQS